jgi:hypothetical protein
VNWASIGESCQWADWASIFFNWTEDNDWRKYADFLFIPSGWPLRICSQVRSFGYRTEVDLASRRAQKDSALLVSMLQKTVYSDERATLHVVLARPDQLSEKSTGCASLYTVRYIAPLQTRLDPVHTVGSVRVDSYTPEQIREDKERAWPQWKKDSRRECDIAPGALSADAEIGASELATVTHIEWRTAPAPGKDPIFFDAVTHFTVLDVDTLPPNWGTTVKGIRAGLSVDRVIFTVGERVPLRTRWENLNAAKSLGQGECSGPAPDLEIQNSEHQVLKTLPTEAMCMGHGFGPSVLPKGTVRHDFRELTTASPPHLPFVIPFPPSLPGPGIYYLVSVWSPRVLDISDTAGGTFASAAGLGEVYGTARSLPVRIEIVPSSNP